MHSLLIFCIYFSSVYNHFGLAHLRYFLLTGPFPRLCSTGSGSALSTLNLILFHWLLNTPCFYGMEYHRSRYRASKPHVGRTLETSVLVLSDPGLLHASVSSLFLCREKERDVRASRLLLGISSDGFNHSWVHSSFPRIIPQPHPTFARFCLSLATSMHANHNK